MIVTFHYHGDLPSLLRPQHKNNKKIVIPIDRRTSVKDEIEAAGIPHTEIAAINVNDIAVSFEHILEASSRIDVIPCTAPFDVCAASTLRPQPFHDVRFLVDANVGKLAKLLRMAGFDTAYHDTLHDKELAEKASTQQRILLTRDRALLKRKNILYGRLIRSRNPADQLIEVMSLFGIREKANPFSRCLECNSLLESIDKPAILHRLEPLTKKYFESFNRCPSCDKIYWAGSHKDKMVHLYPLLNDKK